jgi:hypothetical protein
MKTKVLPATLVFLAAALIIISFCFLLQAAPIFSAQDFVVENTSSCIRWDATKSCTQVVNQITVYSAQEYTMFVDQIPVGLSPRWYGGYQGETKAFDPKTPLSVMVTGRCTLSVYVANQYENITVTRTFVCH